MTNYTEKDWRCPSGGAFHLLDLKKGEFDREMHPCVKCETLVSRELVREGMANVVEEKETELEASGAMAKKWLDVPRHHEPDKVAALAITDLDAFNTALKEWFQQTYTNRIGESCDACEPTAKAMGLKLQQMTAGYLPPRIPDGLSEEGVQNWCRRFILSCLPEVDVRHVARMYPVVHYSADVDLDTDVVTGGSYRLRFRIFVEESVAMADIPAPPLTPIDVPFMSTSEVMEFWELQKKMFPNVWMPRPDPSPKYNPIVKGDCITYTTTKLPLKPGVAFHKGDVAEVIDGMLVPATGWAGAARFTIVRNYTIEENPLGSVTLGEVYNSDAVYDAELPQQNKPTRPYTSPPHAYFKALALGGTATMTREALAKHGLSNPQVGCTVLIDGVREGTVTDYDFAKEEATVHFESPAYPADQPINLPAVSTHAHFGVRNFFVQADSAHDEFAKEWRQEGCREKEALLFATLIAKDLSELRDTFPDNPIKAKVTDGTVWGEGPLKTALPHHRYGNGVEFTADMLADHYDCEHEAVKKMAAEQRTKRQDDEMKRILNNGFTSPNPAPTAFRALSLLDQRAFANNLYISTPNGNIPYTPPSYDPLASLTSAEIPYNPTTYSQTTLYKHSKPNSSTDDLKDLAEAYEGAMKRMRENAESDLLSPSTITKEEPARPMTIMKWNEKNDEVVWSYNDDPGKWFIIDEPKCIPTIHFGGDALHNAVDSGNPIKIGIKAMATEPSLAETQAYLADLRSSPLQSLYFTPGAGGTSAGSSTLSSGGTTTHYDFGHSHTISNHDYSNNDHNHQIDARAIGAHDHGKSLYIATPGDVAHGDRWITASDFYGQSLGELAKVDGGTAKDDKGVPLYTKNSSGDWVPEKTENSNQLVITTSGANSSFGLVYDPANSCPEDDICIADEADDDCPELTPTDIRVPDSFRVVERYRAVMWYQGDVWENDTEVWSTREGAKDRVRQLMFARADVLRCEIESVWERE